MLISEGRTFGTVSSNVTKQKGGFYCAGERTVVIGSTSKKIDKKLKYNPNMSVAEQAYLELLKQYQR
jgi:hypothetical protein|nr:MAG TPA: hypothetical protein [Caudoviricetes sp.]